MANNRLQTAFQKMSRVFNGSWGTSEGIANLEPTPIGNEVVYRAESPEQYQQKMLELQQNKYLQNRWIRAYNKRIYSLFP